MKAASSPEAADITIIGETHRCNHNRNLVHHNDGSDDRMEREHELITVTGTTIIVNHRVAGRCASLPATRLHLVTDRMRGFGDQEWSPADQNDMVSGDIGAKLNNNSRQ